MKDVLSNRNPSDWLPAMAELELNEDFDEIFGEDTPADDELDEPERHISNQTGFFD